MSRERLALQRWSAALALVLWAAYMAGAQTPAAEPPTAPKLALSADTNRPATSTFIPGEKVELTFTVTGLTPAAGKLFLQIEVDDEQGAELDSQQVPVPADQGTTWIFTRPAPLRGLGFYRVRASLSNGVTWPELGSRGAGNLTYAVVPDPATRKLYPPEETHFGMQGGFNKDANVLPYLGVRWVMDGQYGWHRTEPERAGQFAEKLAANTVDGKPYADKGERTRWDFCRFVRNGKEEAWPVYRMMTGIITCAPRWAQANPVDTGTPPHTYLKQGPLSPAGEKAWGAYCAQLGQAARLVHAGYAQRYYELTWEAVPPWNFNGSVADVVRFYEIAYPALHAADPQAFILGPCDAGISNPAALEEWLKAGIGKYIDGFSIHPYHPQPAEREGLILHLRQVKELIRRYAGRDLPLFGTEQGYCLSGSAGNDRDHARGDIRAKLITFGEGFRVNFAFYVHSGLRHGHDASYGHYDALTRGGECGAGKLGPRPLAPAFAAMTWLLEGHRASECIEWLGDTAWGYVFERPDSLVLALWDFGGAPRTVQLPVGAEQVTVYDWMGREKLMAAPGGVLTLPLGLEPSYIKGVSPDLWGSRAKKPVLPAQAQLNTFPGGAVTVSGKVRAPGGEPFRGTLRLVSDAGSGLGAAQVPVELAAGTEKEFAFPLTVPAGSALGTVPVQLLLQDGARTVAAAGVRVAIAAPVKIAAVRADRAARGAKLLVTLQEAQGTAQSGTVQVAVQGVPEGAAAGEFALSAGGTATVALPLPELAADPATRYETLVRVTLAGGYRLEETRPLNFLFASRLHAAPALDGDLKKWEALPAATLNGRERIVRTPQEYDGPADSSARLWFAWDDRALYFAAAVRDDAHLQTKTADAIWQEDCLQLALDLDHGKSFDLTGNGFMDASNQARQSELGFALTPAGAQAVRWTTPDRERLSPGLLKPEDCAVSVNKIEGGLLYEAMIPWASLGQKAAPQAGTALGVGLTVNDTDKPEQRDPSALGLFSLKKRQEFGDLILLGD